MRFLSSTIENKPLWTAST